jgi:hypothetical protein
MLKVTIFSEGIEEKQHDGHSGYPVLKLRLEPGNSRMRNRNASHLTVKYDVTVTDYGDISTVHLVTQCHFRPYVGH